MRACNRLSLVHGGLVHADGRVYFPWADAEDDARAAANSAASLLTAKRHGDQPHLP
jgi:hypothetical protein